MPKIEPIQQTIIPTQLNKGKTKIRETIAKKKVFFQIVTAPIKTRIPPVTMGTIRDPPKASNTPEKTRISPFDCSCTCSVTCKIVLK